MGKSLIQQARGRGGPVFRIRRRAYRYRVGYPPTSLEGEVRVIALINSPGHSAPLAKIAVGKDKRVFYIPAAQGLIEGQAIENCKQEGKIEPGNISALKSMPIGTRVFNIEKQPNDGGKMVRTSGGFATVLKKENGFVAMTMSNKKEILVNENSRATIGAIAGQGRVNKPIVKAGKKWHMKKAVGRAWHRTSAVKMNAVDHPFGGGRGKRIKSKIAKRNAPAGAKVGHLRPRKTGRNKGGGAIA